MNLQLILVVALGVMTIGYVPLSIWLLRRVLGKENIWALTLFTYVIVSIGMLVLVYVWAVANAAAGFVLSQDDTKTVLRIAFFPVAAFPYLFAWVYRTGRFRDGQQ